MIFLTLTHLFKLKPPGLLLKRKRSMAKSWQITWQNKDPNEAVKSPLIIGIRLSYYRAAMASLLLKQKIPSITYFNPICPLSYPPKVC